MNAVRCFSEHFFQSDDQVSGKIDTFENPVGVATDHRIGDLRHAGFQLANGRRVLRQGGQPGQDGEIQMVVQFEAEFLAGHEQFVRGFSGSTAPRCIVSCHDRLVSSGTNGDRWTEQVKTSKGKSQKEGVGLRRDPIFGSSGKCVLGIADCLSPHRKTGFGKAPFV
jgi:hypothetical protein